MKKPHEEQPKVARENNTIPLTCLIVRAGRHCNVCYMWGWLGEYGTFDGYPEFDKKLGEPKGEATSSFTANELLYRTR